ncbi:hypothetical protein CVT26_015356 [Gymnopilus dilepis]|uniref:NADP-dependent oxidoreductase domain-containing protein n=1 Tax=Gymnopilus dilepis TaxID=231916 RepID=A0A409WAA3_9AGAR|nr:hypothetical protein CVT26_015356 [Gymnopilus dilepis]
MAFTEPKSALKIVLGTGVFGEEGKTQTRVHDIKEVEAILEAFESHGHDEVDTARTYCEGTSEEYLGKLNAAARGFKIETKLFPRKAGPEPIAHDEKARLLEGLRKHLAISLKALNVTSLEIYYLHGPDRTVPYEETLRVINDLYTEGYFKRFGISNYPSWEVAEMVGICKAKGYIQPTVYQGLYNAIHRSVEFELLPCLRKFGISFYAYSPLAGGFFTGRYTSANENVGEGSRFDPNTLLGKVRVPEFIAHYASWQPDPDIKLTRFIGTSSVGTILRRIYMLTGDLVRFWKDPFFKALSSIKAVTDKENLTPAEVAQRWLSHHGKLKREYGDAVIIGGSSLAHIQQNLVDFEKPPLPDTVVKALDEACNMASGDHKTALNIVMGAATFGAPGKEHTRVDDIKEVEKILDVFRSHGHSEIDTSRLYSDGTSEEYLGKINAASKGFKIETKLYPVKAGPEPISHDEKGLRKHLGESLKALNTSSVEIWYLHGPDRTVPYEETMRVVNDLYKEGYFKKFGLSNFASWEVAEIVTIAKANGYILPTVYQGVYNAIHRVIEPELLPCLRKFGISFYAFNPLAGGFFTGRYSSPDGSTEQGSRFDPNSKLGQVNFTSSDTDRTFSNKQTSGRYWKEPYFKALASVKDVADKHNLTLTEVALRWISHHGQLKREHGDAVLIGASSIKHVEENLADLEKGPLPEEVVRILDDAWSDVQPYASRYFH